MIFFIFYLISQKSMNSLTFALLNIKPISRTSVIYISSTQILFYKIKPIIHNPTSRVITQLCEKQLFHSCLLCLYGKVNDAKPRWYYHKCSFGARQTNFLWNTEEFSQNLSRIRICLVLESNRGCIHYIWSNTHIYI